MQELITLITLFQKTKFKVNGILHIILEPNSEMERFYEAIASGAVQTDEDARALFPEYDKSPSRLHAIKGKLKEICRACLEEKKFGHFPTRNV